MSQTEFEQVKRRTLEESLENPWAVSKRLFGDVGADIWDFEAHNYSYFLDHAKSPGELIDGLSQLSPLADDALEIAERMNGEDFRIFKEALVVERLLAYNLLAALRSSTRMPEQYLPLLIPESFFRAQPIANKFEVPLGAALIRVMQHQQNGTVASYK